MGGGRRQDFIFIHRTIGGVSEWGVVGGKGREVDDLIGLSRRMKKIRRRRKRRTERHRPRWINQEYVVHVSG